LEQKVSDQSKNFRSYCLLGISDIDINIPYLIKVLEIIQKERDCDTASRVEFLIKKLSGLKIKLGSSPKVWQKAWEEVDKKKSLTNQ
jgi:hypothetical protein